MSNTDDQLREIAKKLAKRRLKGCKRVFDTEAEEQEQYERLLIAYDNDVEEHILNDFEERRKKDPACEMSLVVKAFRFGQSSLTKEEHADWDRQMMVFDEVFIEEYYGLFPKSADKDIS
ncbi:hypothetical protein ACFLV6_02265 [Chloroflexota bacterium]